MRITLIALGAGAGCLLLAGSAVAGPCTGQIDVLSKQLAAIPPLPPEVEGLNTGQGTGADQAGNAAGGNSAAAEALQRAQMADQAGDAGTCMDEVNKAEDALQAQP